MVNASHDSNEKIMVCMYNWPSADTLIRRGVQLSRMLNAPLSVLSIITNQDGGNAARQEAWKQAVAEAGAELLIQKCDGRKPSKVIADAARANDATQLIIGQCGQTRWQEITQGSFANELLSIIGDIDLHIVAADHDASHPSSNPALASSSR